MKKTIIGFLLILSGCASIDSNEPERSYSLGEKRNLGQIIEERKKAHEEKSKGDEVDVITSEQNIVEEHVEPAIAEDQIEEPLSINTENNSEKKQDNYSDLSHNQELKERLDQLREDYDRQRRQIESLSKTEREIIRTRYEQEVNRISKDRDLELRKINLEYDYIAQGIEKDYKKELSSIDNEESKIIRDLELEFERSVLEEEEKFISDYIFNIGADGGENSGAN